MIYFNVNPPDIVRYLISIACIVIVMMVAKTVINRLFRRARKKLQERGDDLSALNFIRYAVLVVLYFLCFMGIVDQIPPLSTLAKSLLAGSGIVAVFLGIAGQEAAGNVISGMMILLFKPFKLGDVIRYLDKDISGVVEEITLRHTIIRTFENKRLIVPNGTINRQVIENANYADDLVCLFLDIGISYESDVDKAMDIIAQEVRKHKDFLDRRTAEDIASGSPDVLIRVTNFANSSIDMRAFVWAANGMTSYQMKSDLLRSIKKAYDAAGIEIPYPHRTVVFKKQDERKDETLE